MIASLTGVFLTITYLSFNVTTTSALEGAGDKSPFRGTKTKNKKV